MKKKSGDLKDFLVKVKQLRGYGDMNSFNVLNEFKHISGGESIKDLMKDFSDPHTYQIAKSNLIEKIEEHLRKQ